MAKRIEGPYDFSHYNFATYADGATWELEAGEDFTVQPTTLFYNAKSWAEREGLELRAKIIPGTEQVPAKVALRFSKPQRLRAIEDRTA